MLDGEYYDVRKELEDHVMGKCTSVPCLRKNDRIEWETGREWFEKLDPEEQKRIMGLSRFAAWKENRINLKDFVYMKQDKIWGSSPAMRTLDEIKVEKAGKDRKIYYNAYVQEPKITEIIKKLW